jgi:hypothetical protein
MTRERLSVNRAAAGGLYRGEPGDNLNTLRVSARRSMHCLIRSDRREQAVPVNDPDADYAWFFRAEFPAVLRTVFLVLHDRGRAEDVTQEAAGSPRTGPPYLRPESGWPDLLSRAQITCLFRAPPRPVGYRMAVPMSPRLVTSDASSLSSISSAASARSGSTR